LDELVRRIADCSLGEYWRKTFAEPLALDLWIGLPEKENARVATMYPAKVGKPPEPKQFYVDLATKGTFARKVFASPYGLHAVSAMNSPSVRAQAIVSFGGIGSANSLAKFYAMLANGGKIEDRQFFSPMTLDWMTTSLSDGTDRVFRIPTAFSAGFMKDSKNAARKIFGRTCPERQSNGSTSSFGHPGAGGSHAFADPENKISFAYVMNQMEQSVLPNEKSLRLVDEIYGSTTTRR
jgi:CubicO group peptidase (beta-lactamase class C family)